MTETRTAFSWKRTTVDGRAAQYGTIGEGLPVLFLHGWALAQHAYRDTLRPLAELGCRIIAPALPGFGGTDGLPNRSFGFAGYASWVDEFCAAVGVEESAVVIGHSFGGGVGIQLAADAPHRVASLVLLNSVGGAWDEKHRMAERPLWRWSLAFPSDVLPMAGGSTRVVPAMLEDAIPNMVRNPLSLLRVGMLARRADLAPQLDRIRLRRTPVTVVRGDGDAIVPRSSFDALCSALQTRGVVVKGSHSWPLADPHGFREATAPALASALAARTAVA